jgi:hypothetical protein
MVLSWSFVPLIAAWSGTQSLAVDVVVVVAVVVAVPVLAVSPRRSVVAGVVEVVRTLEFQLVHGDSDVMLTDANETADTPITTALTFPSLSRISSLMSPSFSWASL